VIKVYYTFNSTDTSHCSKKKKNHLHK